MRFVIVLHQREFEPIPSGVVQRWSQIEQELSDVSEVLLSNTPGHFKVNS